ncbi:MAG: penicillin-binding protein 1C [Bacteroidales bacterium]|nr:penicillin-binding protein 1C [Bacteroidales bacterium]
MNKGTKIVLIVAYVLLLGYAFCLPRNLFPSPCSATLLSRDGTLLGAQISPEGQWYFGAQDAVPDKFEKCIVCYEDKRFRLHGGVDPLSVCRALKQNLGQGRVVSGASTLTMQVIRLSRADAPRSLPEKLWEAVLATRLEWRCSKDEILALYASHAPFGGNVVGLEAAAWRYFGRPADELSWAESATLAVLPNAPALIHPGRNRARLQEKRDALLDKLCHKGVIDETECLLAKDEPLPDKPRPMPDLAYHLLQRARREGGSREVRSTLDADLQRRVNAIAERHFQEYHTNLVDNLGILVAEIPTGEILAYYGNTRGCAPGLRGTDVDMVPAARSSGSTLKPLLYAAMLQDGMILPGTLIKDTPYNYNNFSPKNFNLGYDGAVPAHEVIERSLNVPSVRMLEQYGAERFLKLLQELGFATIDKSADHYGLSLILGGAEISLETLARAYYYLAAKLSDQPVYRELSYESDNHRKCLAADAIPLSPAAIWLTFDALSNANRPEEEASWLDFVSSRKIAWKTGTSWGDRDAWSVGVSGRYVVAVWVGNSDGEGRAGMTGVSYAAPVMFDVFAALPSSRWFEMPLYDMAPVEVCRRSGLPAGALCPERDTIQAPDIAQRPDPCPYHRLVHLDAQRRWQVNAECCPVEEIVTDTCFVLPPAQEWYYRHRHLDYRPLPPKHPQYDAVSGGRNPIEIIYPQSGVTVVPARGLDGAKKGAVLRAAHSDPDAVLYWHLDGEYLGETRGFHEMLVSPAPGPHRLTLIDGDGQSRSVSFNGG